MTWSPRNRPGDDDDDLGAPLNDNDSNRPLSGMSDVSDGDVSQTNLTQIGREWSASRLGT